MKKCVPIFIISVLVFTCFAFVGCKKTDELATISANLTNYILDVDFDATTKTATVKQEVDYINKTGGILNNICFHIYPQFFEEGGTEYIVPITRMNEAYPNGVNYADFNIKRVLVAGEDQLIKYTGDCDGILDVALNSNLLPDKRVKIQIEYEFKLPNCEHRFGYGQNTINIANFYPIACVYENGEFNVSPYNSNGDPFYSDMANYKVTFSVNKNYKVAHTGEFVSSETKNDYTIYNFKADVVRDFAIVLSNNFEIKTATAGKVDVSYYYFNDTNAEKSLQTGVDAVNTFCKKFGNYPYKNLAIVQADFIQGGMEYPNLIMISADVENFDDYCNVIIHETAHQWWYGVVGNDEYKYPWLDEALTEYSTILFYNYNEGYNLTHKKMVEVNRENYSLFITVYEDVLGTIDTSMRAVNEYDTEPEYTYCTYVKGVLMYESLYTLLGEKTFIKALGEYYKTNKYNNVTPQNLILAFETASGQNLHNFFDSWLSGKVIIK